MSNQAVQQAVGAYFDRSEQTEARSLDIWESTSWHQYDGDPWQFLECLTEINGIHVVEDGTDNPLVATK